MFRVFVDVLSAVFDHNVHSRYGGGEFSAQDMLGKPLPGMRNGFSVTFAISSRSSGERNTDEATRVRPSEGLPAISHIV